MNIDIGKEIHATKGAISTLGFHQRHCAGITAAVALGGKVFSIGSTLTRQYAPNVYDKIARKF